MTHASRRRGAPVMLWGTVLAGWIGVRAVLLNGGSPLPEPGVAVPQKAAKMVEPSILQEASAASGSGFRPARFSRSPRIEPRHAKAPIIPPSPSPPPFIAIAAPAKLSPSIVSPGGVSPPLAWQPPSPARAAGEKRWSADGWLLLRPDGDAGGPVLARYGGSQAGAVLRYRLASDGHRPAAYLRAAAALDGSRQKEAAVGLSARPLPTVPLVAAAELRMTSDRFATRTRPAVMAYTEIPPFDLAAGLRAEAYLQGGYVGGKGATGFVDGQARLDRRLATVGRGEFRLGGGGWGGAQKGASRLDVGPTAQVALPLSHAVFARAAIDWRFRVAGRAAPASGPALTLSAGF